LFWAQNYKTGIIDAIISVFLIRPTITFLKNPESTNPFELKAATNLLYIAVVRRWGLILKIIRQKGKSTNNLSKRGVSIDSIL